MVSNPQVSDFYFEISKAGPNFTQFPDSVPGSVSLNTPCPAPLNCLGFPTQAKATVLNSASLPQHYRAPSSAPDTLLHFQTLFSTSRFLERLHGKLRKSKLSIFMFASFTMLLAPSPHPPFYFCLCICFREKHETYLFSTTEVSLLWCQTWKETTQETVPLPCGEDTAAPLLTSKKLLLQQANATGTRGRGRLAHVEFGSIHPEQDQAP